MRTLDFRTFEKLSINPIKISDLDFNKNIKKSDLETFDIIYTLDKYFMVFKYNDFEKYSNYFKSMEYDEGICVYSNSPRKTRLYDFVRLDEYDEKFKDVTYMVDDDFRKRWSISKVYKQPIDFKKHFLLINAECLTQNYLKELILKQHYKEINIYDI